MSSDASTPKAMPFLAQAAIFIACAIGGHVVNTAVIDAMLAPWNTCAAVRAEERV